ncbi:hypothetical protein J7T55_005569 [Diaporthe amygdali]|uniref:uncharacterized protein n=1 Tax=Phomopsis amygdali TaxID=1214568 RepID=UPI0022FED166|nr:uncharacterized protein J7T55_005569 [Diaporthe amygdali]KAJ0124231.1 hypothetical protein J7T55_005569 [Diaporthe amygdali]
MVAISEFPPITGEPAVISRTGPPKVTGATGKDGIIKPFKIREISDEEIDWNEKPEVSETSGLMSWDLQIDYSPVISDLRFIIVRTLIPDQSVLYQQVNLETMVPIEDAFMQAEWVQLDDGSTTVETNGTLYRGEFDDKPTRGLCDQFEARDSAALRALKQPGWEELYPPAEYNIMYTVHRGKLYLTWRIRFDLTQEVDDEFVVWVSARDCKHIVAAASIHQRLALTLEDVIDDQKRLFKERGIPLKQPGTKRSGEAL